MTDDRHEELASLYAFDLLDGEERTRFEALLAQDSRLRTLVRSFREASSSLALGVAQPPPAALRERIFASIPTATPAVQETGGRAVPPPPLAEVIQPPPSIFRRPSLSWAVAACFAVLAAWLGQRHWVGQDELATLRRQNALADVSLQSLRQQLEADRLASTRKVEALDRLLASAQAQAAQSRLELDRTASQLAAARREVAAGEVQIVALTQRVDALAGASAWLGSQLEQVRDRMGLLTSEMLRERELANFRISVLASLARENPQALAVALWDDNRKEGMLRVDKLPALAPNQDYQLWVIDPQYRDPVDGGVFVVDPESGAARYRFKTKQPVVAVNAFAISLERKGGVPKAEGPIVLLGK